MKPDLPDASSHRVMQTPSEAAPVHQERLWVAQARSGDQAAFRGLVEAHRERAYLLALRITGAPADAEEVAQDAFVRVWRSLATFRGESSFGTWLHQIVARQALDRRRSLQRRARVETPVESPDGLEEEGVAPAAAGGPDSAALRLERLLGILSEPQRAVVALYYYEDCPVADVAAALELPEGTVKTHLSRARLALREAWEREERKGATVSPEERT